MTAPDRALMFAVDASTIDLTEGDRLLADELRRRGVDVRPMVWGAACSPSDTVVIRSTWDYADRPHEFRKWLDDLDATGATVVNPVALLRWNMHKGYLAELAARGVAVVPTEMLVRGSTRSLADVMAARRWGQVVAKPAIGASARETVRADVADPAAFAVADEHVRRLVEVEDLLLQPFLPSIETDGEVSVVVIGGEITHAVAKRPAVGEWRVQSEYGGFAERIPVTAEHERAVASVLDAVEGSPAYARVDLVAVDGVLLLMELELIEPDLFFQLAPDFAERFADLLVTG